MKPLLTISILLIVIILGGILTYNYLYTQSKLFSEKLSILEESIIGKDWVKASEQYKNINEDWHKSHKKYSVLIEHFEIDNINMNIAELKAYIDAKDQTQSQAKITILKILIMHMPEKEALTLGNIF